MTMLDQDLAARSCMPCRGGVPPLTSAEAEALARCTPDWTLCDDATRIERHFVFKNFAAAFGLVGTVASIAETAGHHPDITFGWGYATVSLRTHTIHGLHGNDFIMAAKIDRAAGASGAISPA